MSRSLRRELQSISDRIEDEDNPALGESDHQVIVDGLTASESLTRRRAIHILEDISSEAIPSDVVDDGLVHLLKLGLKSEEDSDHHLAEKAARLISQQALVQNELNPWPLDLAEQMIEPSNPSLRAGGAALLSAAVVLDDYDVPDEQLDHLIEQVLLTNIAVDDFDREADLLNPTLLIFSEITEEHGEELSDRLSSIPFERYLHGPHANSRSLVARLLRGLAADQPEFVEPYLLDLILRLRDPNADAVLHAGTALSELSDSINVDELRPACRFLDGTLESDQVKRFAGGLRLIEAIVEQQPPWIDQLPIEIIKALPENETITDEPPLLELVESIVNQHPSANGSGVIGD